jgi:hypothetical protein
MISACACMEVRPGDLYCYCGLKSRGLCTKHYEWTEQELESLRNILSLMFKQPEPCEHVNLVNNNGTRHCCKCMKDTTNG